MHPFFPTLFSFTVAISIPVGNSFAEPPSQPDPVPLRLDEVIRDALAHNPAIQAAQENWSAMKARVPQAEAWDDPKVSFEERLDRSAEVQRNAFADQVMSAEQTIPVSGKNRARARAAGAGALFAFEQVRRQELDVVAAVTSAWFRLSNAYAQIELNRQNLASLKQIEEASQSRYAAGGQGAVFVLMAQTEYGKLLESARDLDLEAATEQSRLNVLLNRDAFAPLGQPAGTAGPAPIAPVDRLRALMLDNRPEIRMAIARVRQQLAALELAHREWIPDPAVNVQAQRYNGAAQGVSEVDAGISFNVPWVNARKYSAGVTEAFNDLQAAEADLQRSKIEAVGLLREALEKAETSHHHLQLFRDKLIPQAQQAFDASELGYEAGKLSFNDWIAAQRTLRDLQAAEQQHLTDYGVALAELQAVVGCQLPAPIPSQPSIRTAAP